MSRRRLCALDDIPDGGSAGFAVPRDGARDLDVMALRQGGAVYVYVNCCPHQGEKLDYVPGQFMDNDGVHVVCTLHMATFRVEDGVCDWGPCNGDRLDPVATDVVDNTVFVTLP